jgi:DNA-binding NarL/FixJ family response regulator
MTPKQFRQGLDALSTRESEVMSLVADGRSNPEIAQVLGLARRTIENTIVRANKRFESEGLPKPSRTEFIRLWWENSRA